MTARGADFSSWNDDAHLKAALQEGLEFAFVKLTEGTHYVYPQAAERLQRFRTHGLIRGVYHYLDAPPSAALDSVASGARQWAWFQRHLEGLAHADELLIALDYEAPGTTDAQARAFIRAGRKAGYRVGLYSSSGTHAYKRLGQSWRWVAKWGKTPPPHGWTFWQFARGEHGNPDWDVYNGTRAQLHAFTAKNTGHGHYHVRFPGHPVEVLGPYRTPRAAALHALAYALRHPRRRSYTITRG